MTTIKQQTIQSASFSLDSSGPSRVQSQSVQRTEIVSQPNHGPERQKRPQEAHLPFDPQAGGQYAGGQYASGQCGPVSLFPGDGPIPGMDSRPGRQSIYIDARNCANAERLLELAHFEADEQMMPEVKAGDILREAYHAALKCRNATTLVRVAELENAKQLMPDIKAGDVLREAYHKAIETKNPYAMMRAAQLENEAQLLPELKAGDMLREAYHSAIARHDAATVLEIAEYEAQFNLMPDLKAEDLMREASTMIQHPSYRR